MNETGQAPSKLQDRSSIEVGTAQMWYLFFAFVTAATIAMNFATVGASRGPISDAYVPGFGKAVAALAMLALVATAVAMRGLRSAGDAMPTMRRAFVHVAAGLSLLSALLCALFAEYFYDFLAPGSGAPARLGHLPAFAPDQGWARTVPAEFYLLITLLPILILSVYLVLCLFFVEAYNVSDRDARGRDTSGTRRRERRGFLVLIGLLLLSWLIRQSPLAYPGLPDEAPRHTFFLIAGIGIPSVWLSARARELVNWRAYTITCFGTVVAGIVWEASLGARLGWWTYDPDRTLGILFEAWGLLPFDAALYWLFVGMPMILALEAYRAHLVDRRAHSVRKTVRVGTDEARVGALLFAALTLAAAVSLVEPIPPEIIDDTFRPHGLTIRLAYTYSLILFVLPTLMMVAWLVRARAEGHFDGKTLRAFGIASLVMAVAGFLLDVLVGLAFFEWDYSGLSDENLPVLGRCANDLPVLAEGLRCIPGYNWDTGLWVSGIPIEEFLFYATGAVFVLASYLWLCRHFVPACGPSEEERIARSVGVSRLIHLHRRGLLLIVALLVVAFTIHQSLPGTEGAGIWSAFPGYAFFLILVLGLPAVLLFDALKALINWPALFIVCFQVLVLGMIWEAALGVPYGWWGYRDPSMMGLYVAEWNGLPVEAVALWFLIALPTVFLFETIRTVLHQRDHRPSKPSNPNG